MRSIRRAAIRTGTLGVVAVGLLAMPSASVPAPQPPRPLQDSVTGSGTNEPGSTIEISAQSGPNGENPSGQATGRLGDGTVIFTGVVTCLTVRGNVALMSADSNIGPLSLRVTDNAASSTPDRVQVTIATRPLIECSSPEPSYIVDFALATGDYIVVDAPALPTTKEQCKNGGWRNFGDTFKNQGQCVAFVQQGPKP